MPAVKQLLDYMMDQVDLKKSFSLRNFSWISVLFLFRNPFSVEFWGFSENFYNCSDFVLWGGFTNWQNVIENSEIFSK